MLSYLAVYSFTDCFILSFGEAWKIVTRHGKTYTNDHPLNVRKLTDNKQIANSFQVVLTLCINVLMLSPDLLTVCVNALTDCSNALTVCSNALTGLF